MKKFIRTKEDFKCINCRKTVKGDGYTNHCPHCLYSRHVDVDPGDRKSDCGGLMDPIGVTLKNKEYKITHRCVKCGTVRMNRVSDNDDWNVVVALAKKYADSVFKTIN